MPQFDYDFYLKLRDDMLKTKQRRFQYQLAKVTAIASLLGIGIALSKDNNIIAFFYIIPFVAIAFDLLVYGECFGLKRMAYFIYREKEKQDDAEFAWEEFVKENPDKVARYENFMLTSAAAIGSLIVLTVKGKSGWGWFKEVPNIIWLLALIALLVLIAKKFGVFLPASEREWHTEKLEARWNR